MSYRISMLDKSPLAARETAAQARLNSPGLLSRRYLSAEVQP